MGSGGVRPAFPLTPLGTEGGKHPSPHRHGVWGGPVGVGLPSHTTDLLWCYVAR